MADVILAAASRALLGGAHRDVDDDDAHDGDGSDNTKPLRIAAVFVVLAGGILGGVPPCS